MPQPDWAQKQKADEKSPFHGRRDAEHGPQEHGMGAKEEHPTGKGKNYIPAAGLVIPAGVDIETAGEDTLAGLTTLPTTFYLSATVTPPVTNQGTTPQCVAYSSAYDQNNQDRPEQGSFVNFNEPLFFQQIGGTADGASMSVALNRRVSYGIPVTTIDQHLNHRIASYTPIALTVTAFKSALVNRNHGVLKIGPWYHSWFHPLASGKLPAPDYLVGWHARWYRGYNDTYGARLRNSWGTGWGPIGGDAFEPYTYLVRDGYMWVTTDR